MDSDKFISSTIKMFLVYGVWRSLVARTAGGREVAGSNPVAPIGKSVVLRHFFFLQTKTCAEEKMNCAEKTGRKLWGK